MKIINKQLLDTVTSQAIVSPRLRMNHNLHLSLDDKVQRLLNALEPGTQLPIHRHPDTEETYIILRGKMEVKVYNDAKELQETHLLDVNDGTYGINIPKNTWHTVEALEHGTVIFEVKEGPYTPFSEDNILK